MKGDCPWCVHPWDKHGYPEGCYLLVGAGTELGECPCTVTNDAHGQALDTIERLRQRRHIA